MVKAKQCRQKKDYIHDFIRLFPSDGPEKPTDFRRARRPIGADAAVDRNRRRRRRCHRRRRRRRRCFRIGGWAPTAAGTGVVVGVACRRRRRRRHHPVSRDFGGAVGGCRGVDGVGSGYGGGVGGGGDARGITDGIAAVAIDEEGLR